MACAAGSCYWRWNSADPVYWGQLELQQQPFRTHYVPFQGLHSRRCCLLHVWTGGCVLRDGFEGFASGSLGTQRPALALLSPPSSRPRLRFANRNPPHRCLVPCPLRELRCMGMGHRISSSLWWPRHGYRHQVLRQHPQRLRHLPLHRPLLPRLRRPLRLLHHPFLPARLRNSACCNVDV